MKQTELSLWTGGNTGLKTTCSSRFLSAFLRDPLTLHSGHSSRVTGVAKDLVPANRGSLWLTPSCCLELPHLLTTQRCSKERGKVTETTRSFPVLGPHLISSPSLWGQKTTRWAP